MVRFGSASSMGSNILLALAATLATLTALEAALRVVDAVSQHTLFDMPPIRSPNSSTQVLTLADLVQVNSDPDLLYELRPGVRGRFINVEVVINELGFRGPPARPGPHPGVMRILGLGDSIMFGWGVNEEETLLERVAARFRKEYPAGPPIEAVNLWCAGLQHAPRIVPIDERSARLLSTLREEERAMSEPLGDVATRVLFENAWVKVWEMTLAPGEISALHRHD